jgi:hypothetical protein
MNKERIIAWIVLSFILSVGLIVMLMISNSLLMDYSSLYCKQYNATAKIECTDRNNNVSCYKCCYANNSCFDFKNVTLI